jgi:D-lactate dehydrogenase
MRIALCTKDDTEKAYLTEHLLGHDLVFVDDLRDTPDPGSVECLCIFVKTPVQKAELDLFPTLRGVVTRSTGYDHIDIEEAHRRGITVSNVPAYGENTIAEYAFAMLLALSRRICETDRRIRIDGLFTTDGLDGFDLHGKKIGVVGTGHTGERALRIARGFGMEAIAFDVVERKHLEAEIGFMYVTFEDLLAQSDVISLHAPYNGHTHHMINMDNKHLVRRGAYLINTARGGLVQTRALIAMLEDGTLTGAGLDVVEEEGHMVQRTSVLTSDVPDPVVLQTLLANQYLIDHPDVLIMPHNAFNTREARERILATTVANVRALADGVPANTL